MVGDRLGIGVRGMQERGRALVLGRPHWCRHVEVDGGPQERVREPERLVVAQHSRRDQRRQRSQCGRASDPRQALRVAELAAVAEHRDGARELGAGGIEAADACEHGRADAAAGETRDESCALDGGHEPRVARSLEQLAQQPRIATTGDLARLDELVRGFPAGVPRDQLARGGEPQRLRQANADAGDREQFIDPHPSSASAGRVAASAATGRPSILRAR